jgi:hypothetical protein
MKMHSVIALLGLALTACASQQSLVSTPESGIAMAKSPASLKDAEIRESKAGTGFQVRHIPSTRYANLYAVEYTPPVSMNRSVANAFLVYRIAELARDKGFPAFARYDPVKSAVFVQEDTRPIRGAVASYVRLFRDPVPPEVSYFKTRQTLELLELPVTSGGQNPFPTKEQVAKAFVQGRQREVMELDDFKGLVGSK